MNNPDPRRQVTRADVARFVLANPDFFSASVIAAAARYFEPQMETA